MSKRFVLTSLLLFLYGIALNAGNNDDFGSWLSIQANKSIGNAYASMRAEHRTNNSFRDTEAAFFTVGGGYKFFPWLKTDLNYEYWKIAKSIDCHKAVLSATGTLSSGNLSASLREKLEFAVMPQSSTNSWTLRSRLRAQYKFENSCFSPYLMAEVFTWSGWQRSLYYIGSDISISKLFSLDVFYLYHVPSGSSPVHTFGLGAYLNF